jgi:hypothetical protein
VNSLGKINDPLNRTEIIDKKAMNRSKKLSVLSLKKGKSKKDLQKKQSHKDFPEIKSLTRVLYSQLRERVAQISQKKSEGFPMLPSKALNLFHDKLTEYETKEIVNYGAVHFIGEKADKSVYNGSINNGHDDKKGNYKAAVHDHIAYRYEIIGLLGKGSFGQAFKCFDHKNKELVAVKIIKNNKKIFKQVEVEVKVLKYIKENDLDDEFSIVRLKDSFLFRNHYVPFMLIDSVWYLNCCH